MKRIKYLIFFLGACSLMLTGSCKKFLNVEPIDRLGSNSFWKTKSDVESAVADCYGLIYDRLTIGPYHNLNGDIRAGEFICQGFPVFVAVAKNDLSNSAQIANPDRYKGSLLSDWYPFYQTIAACNIALDRLNDLTFLSDLEKTRYQAEVKYIRSFTYFYISRIYGDVPLYTEAYDATARPRTNFIEVLKFCVKELEESKEALPWQYDDPTNWGVRASRASSETLIANCYMWMAGFDKANQRTYWQKTADAVMNVKNSGYFQLMPIEDFKKIFKGKTRESIFEFSVNKNYGSETKYVSLGQWTTHAPIVNYGATSDGYFLSTYIQKLYPSNLPDKRRDLWFYLPYINNETQMFLKYSNVTDVNNFLFDDNMIIFRYSGTLLLGAEALASLGKDSEAIPLLNMVRNRAGANEYLASEGALIDAVFMEEQKELIGEGVRWYDLVRTGRIMDNNQCVDFLTQEQFNQGAWTWPIDAKARVNNPGIVLNQYWVK
ncbi:RagB/SusD family nutrient uptake outer membrane protein [Pedobacter nyackensis]|uniref:RagB/SusD family nutrient uptake outer membrane protein n=1 Tax=Pedobacter nyackensis TaxID=475255 RepID=UPI00292F76D4|nr:RagB/SusD family nutrient uptake outer membrane protein [Pedobacter nyackensis]